MQTLFAVGNIEAHAIDPLTRLALRDGMRLTPTSQDASWVIPQLQQVRISLTELHDGQSNGRIPNLHRRREELATAISQRRQDVEDRGRDFAAQVSQWRDQVAHWEGAAQVAHLDLQAAQCDLTECNDRLWGTRTRTIEKQVWTSVPPILQTTLKTETPTVDTTWRMHIAEIDHQIERTRSVLHDLANSRMVVSKEAADHAGLDATGPAVYFADQRGLLGALEQQLIGWQTAAQTTPTVCHCTEITQQIQTTVPLLRQQVYALCQNLGRQQASHQRWLKHVEREGIDRLESDLNTRLQQLHVQREVILRSAGRTLTDRLSVPLDHEAEHCLCQDHTLPPAIAPEPTVVTALVAPEPQLQTVTDAVTESSARVGDPLWQQELSESTRLRFRAWQDALEATRIARSQLETAEQALAQHEHDPVLSGHEQELHETHQNLSAAQSQFQSLTDQHAELTETHRSLSAEIPAPVLQEASAMLEELTQGRYREFRFRSASDDGRIGPALFVNGPDTGLSESETGLPMSALSRGTLDQAALSLRLALTAEYARQGWTFPLILDDILVDSDEPRLRRAAELIYQFANSRADNAEVTTDCQILFLTCQERLASRFEALGAVVREMPGSRRRTRAETVVMPRSNPTRVDAPHPATAPIAPAATSPAWSLLTSAGRSVSQALDPLTEASPDPVAVTSGYLTSRQPTVQQALWRDAEPTAPVERPLLDVAEKEAAPPVLDRAQPDAPHWLRADSSLAFVPSMGEQMSRRMGTVGLRNVADLVNFDVEQSGIPLDSLQISAGQLRGWQSESRLLICVADLTGRDAQMLVAAGIHSPQELGEADPAVLERTIRQLQVADAQTQALLPWLRDVTRWPDAETIQRWISAARHARTFRQAADAVGWQPRPAESDATRRTRTARPAQARRNPRSQKTASRRTRLSPTAEAADSFASVAKTSTESSGTTFYLHEQSPIVDAPSIGPKTAERLEKIGLIFVGDLLNTSAEKIATRLDDKRVPADVVRAWQQQSRLVCRIPGLRGHDAQVLVACGITEAEDVAKSTPDALFRRVEPFVRSKEGQRVLRSSHMPDLAEVTDWIAAAQSLRTRAA